MLPIKTLPIVERWECAGCGRCCHGSLIHLDAEDLAKLREQKWDQHPDFLGTPTTVRESWLSTSYRLAQRADGACVFLLPDGRCRIHAEFGADAKPLVCRMFPWQLVPQEKRAILTLRRACPTAAADIGPELKDYQSQARKLAETGKLLARSPRLPAITRRHRGTWDDFMAAADALEKLTCDERFPLVRRLAHGLRFCELLEQADLKTFTGSRLRELCDLLVENADDVGEHFSDRTSPERKAAVLFRQVCAEYLRLHPTFTVQASWGERWRMAKAALLFARGRGLVPPLHRGLPAATFESLERPLGHLDPTVQRPFARFFETHAASKQYALVSRPNWSLVESYRALAFSLPVALWIMRLCCTDRDLTATDAIDMVTIMDRGQGFAPLVSGQHRSRIAMLVRLGSLDRLLVWYAR